LWSNGWMYQDTTSYRSRPQPRRHCGRWKPSSPSPKVHSPQFLANVRCGQRAGWTKMPLGMALALATLCSMGPNSPEKGTGPIQFLAHVCCGQTAGWITMPLGRR